MKDREELPPLDPPISSPTPVMQAVARWARGLCLHVVIEIGWSSTRDGWLAAATGLTTWPGVSGPPRPHHQAWAAWVARLLTKALPALESLAARGIDPVRALTILQHVERGRPPRERQQGLLRNTAQLRRDAAALDRAASVLRRHELGLVDQTPTAEVHGFEGGPHGRRLYSWSLAVLDWAAVVLRAVPPPARGRVQETATLVTALALQRIGLTVGEVGVLLSSAGIGDYPTADDERTKGWLKRARSNKRARAAAQRLAASVENVPANVPATIRNRAKTSQRQPTTKRKTPR